jgi:DNA (cytosine-5)-methyltransferase 1
MTRSGTLFQLQPLVRRTGGTASGLWPTPRTTDVQAGRGCVQIGNGLYRPSRALAEGRLVGGANLADAVKMWPTPSASGFECADVPALLARRERCKEKNKNGNGFALTLNQAVKVAMFPTPAATDGKGAGKTGTLRDRLDYAVERGATKSKTYQQPPQDGGSLNPTWVEWLMGFPLGWTALDASETPSSRRSSKSSGGRSLKRKRG